MKCEINDERNFQQKIREDDTVGGERNAEIEKEIEDVRGKLFGEKR